MALVLNNTVHVENYDVPDGRGTFEAGTPKSELPDWAVAKIGDHCYSDDSEEPVDEEVEEDTASDLHSLTVAELRELATQRGVDAPATAKKADLIEVLS